MIRSSVLTYGFRFLAAIAAFSVLGAVVFAIDGDEGLIDNVLGPLTGGWKGGVGNHAGYLALIGAAAAAAGLAGILVAFRDGDYTAQSQVVRSESLPLTRTTTDTSLLPVVIALLVIAALVGLTSSPGLFQASLFGIAGVGGAWTVRAWSNRATGDDEVNTELYHRVIDPLRVPLVSAGVVAFIAIGLSRVLLATDKVASTLVFIVVATVIFGLAVLIAARPRINKDTLSLVVLVIAAALLVAAVIGVIVGQREFHHVGPAAEDHAPAEGAGTADEGAADTSDPIAISGRAS